MINSDFTSLHKKIDDILDRTRARVGVLIYDAAKDSKIYGCREDEQFHLASVIKMLVLFEGLIQVHEGRLNLKEEVKISELDHCKGSFVDMFDTCKSFSVKELLTFMIALSDSLLADYFIKRFTKEKINERFKNIGLKNTRIDTTILQLNVQSYGLSVVGFDSLDTWKGFSEFLSQNPGMLYLPENIERSKEFCFEDHNYSTPAEVCQIINRFVNGLLVNSELTQLGMRILRGQTAKSRIPYMLPPWLEYRVGHQIGTITDERGYLVINDCGFVTLENNNIVMVFLANNIEDEFYKVNQAIAEISSEVITKFSNQ